MNARPIAAPYHDKVRRVARFVGPILVGLGALFIIFGLVDFFSSVGSFGGPRYFWCLFVGMPLLFFGGVSCQIGFMGAAARYAAAETAPVAADTFNYLAGETRPGVTQVASAIAEGLGRPGVPIATRLQQLDQLRKDSLITEAEYTEQRRRILGTL